jgi:hypothetical protein
VTLCRSPSLVTSNARNLSAISSSASAAPDPERRPKLGLREITWQLLLKFAEVARDHCHIEVFENGLLRLAVKEEWTPPRMARFFGTPSRHVGKWHLADMLSR